MNTLVTSLSNLGLNERGALTNVSTGSAVLDFFSKSGGFRGAKASNDVIVNSFKAAYAEDKNLALKALFYSRDVRGGQGERNVFRAITQYLANNEPDVMARLVPIMAEYGRWDDVVNLLMTKVEPMVTGVIQDQFMKDLVALGQNKDGREVILPISLLAKWLPSENASSKNTRFLANYVRKKLGFNAATYRKNLSGLRAALNVLERQLCANEWDKVNYSHVPSQAGLKYRTAFFEHDKERYEAFVGDAKAGKVKVNTKTLFPYELVAPFFGTYMHKIGNDYHCDVRELTAAQEASLDMLWTNLPNYFEEKEENSLVICDTSGSMRGLPIQVAISLAIYTAERNKGAFHNYFVSFSEHPQLQALKGATIGEKVRNLSTVGWNNNTDLAAVFNLILDRAVKHNVKEEDMPARIYIVSDFQFDRTRFNSLTGFEEIQAKYKESNYQMPEVVFWNVRAATGVPATKEDNVKLVSGCSPSIFKQLLSGKSKTAFELMLETLMSARYEPIGA